jgi:hypothetical protein
MDTLSGTPTCRANATWLIPIGLKNSSWPDRTFWDSVCEVSHNPVGSLTTPSAVIVPGPKVMTWYDWITQKTMVVRRTRRKEVVPEGQMELGI